MTEAAAIASLEEELLDAEREAMQVSAKLSLTLAERWPKLTSYGPNLTDYGPELT